VSLSKEKLIDLHEKMTLIREFEKAAERNFLDNEIPGFIHLYMGEEAIAAGIIRQLKKEDYITSTHRGHGHMLAKGADPKEMMAELYGKESGCCKGKGGSMHIMDFDLGVFGANGEVAGGLPIAAGAGFAIKNITKTDQIVVSFFGDGASNRGPFHEALNWASIYELPILFVAENNCYASTIKCDKTTSIKDISDRAQGYNIKGVTIDGNDLMEVYNTANELIKEVREEKKPILLECKTYRLKGHFVGDPMEYRPEGEEDEYWDTEPIGRFEDYLLENGLVSEEEIKESWEKSQTIIQEAVEYARNEEFPAAEDALDDLFADDTGYQY